MALVADIDVLFAGDLCFFGVTPLAFQGDPATWADVLDAFADLAVDDRARARAGRRRAEVRELQEYLRHCVAGAIPPGPWDTWPERDPRDAINIERAQLLAAGPRRDAAGDADRPRLRVVQASRSRRNDTVCAHVLSAARGRGCRAGCPRCERVPGVRDVLEGRRPCPCRASSASSALHRFGREEVVVLGVVTEHRRASASTSRARRRRAARRRTARRRRSCRPVARRRAA